MTATTKTSTTTVSRRCARCLAIIIQQQKRKHGATSGDPTSTADDLPLRKIKKEEEEGAC